MRIFATPRYQEIIVHDLRTPLNVIMLALRMIDDAKLKSDDELAEDLGLIRANAAELERMLSVVVDLSRIPEQASNLAIGPFDPARLLRDVVQAQAQRAGAGPISLNMVQAPPEVMLDEILAQLAMQKALLNTVTSAQGKPVHVQVDGPADRLVMKFVSEAPPRDSVRTQTLTSDQFERVLGTPAERRGLDLSIVVKITELFGGTTHLEARPGQGTTLTLDWPARIARPG